MKWLTGPKRTRNPSAWTLIQVGTEEKWMISHRRLPWMVIAIWKLVILKNKWLKKSNCILNLGKLNAVLAEHYKWSLKMLLNSFALTAEQFANALLQRTSPNQRHLEATAQFQQETWNFSDVECAVLRFNMKLG